MAPPRRFRPPDGGAGNAVVAMAPPDFAGSIGLGKRSVAKEEGASARSTEEDDEPDLLKLSPVGEVLRRASEAGSGVLSVGRCAIADRMVTAPDHAHISRPRHPYACEPVPQRQARLAPRSPCSCTPAAGA